MIYIYIYLIDVSIYGVSIDASMAISMAYVREYPHKIWPYIVQYLHFRVLKFPLNTLPYLFVPLNLHLALTHWTVSFCQAKCEVVYPNGEAALADVKLTMSMNEVKAQPRFEDFYSYGPKYQL